MLFLLRYKIILLEHLHHILPFKALGKLGRFLVKALFQFKFKIHITVHSYSPSLSSFFNFSVLREIFERTVFSFIVSIRLISLEV